MNSNQKILRVKLTQLKISKPFLKFIGRDLSLATLKDRLEASYYSSPNFNLVLGDICVANVDTNEYERCRIIKISGLDNIVTVLFTDSGIHGYFHRNRLRILQDEKLKKMPPLCNEYVLAGVAIDERYQGKVKKLHDMIINKNFHLVLLAENEAGKFADLRSTSVSLVDGFMLKDPDLSSCFKAIILENQILMMKDRIKEKELKIIGLKKPETFVESPESSPDSEKNIAPFDTRISDSRRDVRITAYEDGPFKFYVQFTSKDDNFQQFQVDLQKHKRSLVLLVTPKIGQRCFVLIGNELFRAEIKKKSDENNEAEYLVRLLENGAMAIVSSEKVFAIPSRVSNVPPYAKKFKLSGFTGGSIKHLHHNEINFYFKHITENKLLALKSVSESAVESVCQLFYKTSNIFEELRRWSPHNMKYCAPKILEKNAYFIEICSVVSPKEFYVVTLSTPEHEQYLNMLNRLKYFDPPNIESPRVGDACVIKSEDIYLRNIIIEKITSHIFKCKCVDTGYVDEYHENEIKVIVEEFLELRPMASRCSLNEFADRVVKEEEIKRFNDVCRLHSEFQMRILKRYEETYFVELEDRYKGSKIINSVLNKETNDSCWSPAQSEWSNPPSSISTHFKIHCVDNLNETRNTLTESPGKNKVDEDDEEFGFDLEENLADHKSSTLHDIPDSNWGVCDDFGVADSVANAICDDFDLVREKVISSNIEEEPDDEAECVRRKEIDEKNSNVPSLRRQKVPFSTCSSGYGSDINDSKPLGEPLKITALANPTVLTIQKLSQVEEYKTYLEDLQDSVPALPPLITFSDGSYCIAYNSSIQKWCRAIVLDSKFLRVKCVDDGSVFKIKLNEMKFCGINFIFKESFGIECSLPIRWKEECEQELIDYLRSIMNSNLTYYEIGKFKESLYIELFNEGKNVTDTLVEKSLVNKLCIVPSGPVYICHIISALNFSVQMEKSTTALNAIIDYRSIYKKQEIKNPKPGMIVMALYKEDKGWYRAKIISVLKDGFKVDFIDQGDSGIVGEIGAIQNEVIANISPLAFKCSLIIPQGLSKFSEMAEKKFVEIAANGTKKFDLKMIEPGCHNGAFVEVLCDGVNIANIITFQQSARHVL